ncbi:hypothetical protein BDN70DRAFT_406425 [Pholiota conissans]|uniref:Uncharacterized protein n=1 Tax=Pholiota conissans TaxID=109636 RepID=A0A9P5YSJ0_9AGAR|nr:hypothetical protein BDN70DRAFT_406425 [Pholiota conissans]
MPNMISASCAARSRKLGQVNGGKGRLMTVRMTSNDSRRARLSSRVSSYPCCPDVPLTFIAHIPLKPLNNEDSDFIFVFVYPLRMRSYLRPAASPLFYRVCSALPFSCEINPRLSSMLSLPFVPQSQTSFSSQLSLQPLQGTTCPHVLPRCCYT